MNVVDRWLPHGARSQARPTRIIVHSMCEKVLHMGRVLDAPDFLDASGLSAHALVAPDGTITRCRRDDQGAWHAKGHNAGTLGIEFLVPGCRDYATFARSIAQPWATWAQLAAGSAWVRSWMSGHGIGVDQVVRHGDVDPERKIDPGAGFPWVEFRRQLVA